MQVALRAPQARMPQQRLREQRILPAPLDGRAERVSVCWSSESCDLNSTPRSCHSKQLSYLRAGQTFCLDLVFGRDTRAHNQLPGRELLRNGMYVR